MKKVKVIQNPEKEIPVGVMAESIVKISDAMKQIANSRATRKMIVALIHDSSKLGKTQIEVVLNNLDHLESTWLKKK